MRRRDFITLVSGIAAVWPFAARAQQDDRTRRIAVLMGLAEDDPETKARLAAFRLGLEKLSVVRPEGVAGRRSCATARRAFAHRQGEEAGGFH
jgi:hypothetical protein